MGSDDLANHEYNEKAASPSPTASLNPLRESGSNEDDDAKYLTGFKLLATMVSITLVGFLMLLDASIISTAIPRITTDFHSLTDVGWYGTAYLLGNCAAQPLTGKMYSLFSNKWTFITFFAIFELGSTLCGAASSSKMLIVGRAVAGLGSSGLLNGGYTIVFASVAPKRQAALYGLVMGMAQLGLISGPLIGGALTQHASWRWCFYINLPCGAVVASILPFINLPEHGGKSVEKRTTLEAIAKLDLIGFVIFAGAAIQLLIALNWGGNTYAWNSSIIIGLFCGSGATFLVFLAWSHHKADQAMIPLAAFMRPVILANCVYYAFFAGCMLTSTYYLPIYFQSVRGASPTASGVDLLPVIGSTVVFSVVFGVLLTRIGYYLPLAVASATFLTVGTGLLTLLSPTTSTGRWIGYQIIQGIGRGLGFQQLGGAIFLSLAQVIFETNLEHGLAVYAPDVNPQTVIVAGATGVRGVVSNASLPGVILSYSKAVDRVMYLALGSAAATLLFAFGTGWVNIKEKKKTSEVSSA